MITPETIQFLSDLVGWNTPDVSTGIVVTDDNLKSTSGRIFKSFHALVSAENVKDTMPIISPSNDQLNTYLLECKKQGALDAIHRIFYQSEYYITTFDYSLIVEQYSGVIAKVVGYATAAYVMDMMINSTRVNHTERIAKYQTLKIELNGLKDGNGIVQQAGVLNFLYYATLDAQNIIFPQSNKVEIYNHDW